MAGLQAVHPHAGSPATRAAMSQWSPAAASSGSSLFHSSGDCSRGQESRDQGGVAVCSTGCRRRRRIRIWPVVGGRVSSSNGRPSRAWRQLAAAAGGCWGASSRVLVAGGVRCCAPARAGGPARCPASVVGRMAGVSLRRSSDQQGQSGRARSGRRPVAQAGRFPLESRPGSRWGDPTRSAKTPDRWPDGTRRRDAYCWACPAGSPHAQS